MRSDWEVVPDITLIHFETNEIGYNFPTSDIYLRLWQILNQLWSINPYMNILVAKIIPTNTTSQNESLIANFF